MFPFARFPGVDTVLGPEMRSTGEVMGLDVLSKVAFAKSQLGGGTRVPRKGTCSSRCAMRTRLAFWARCATSPRRGSRSSPPLEPALSGGQSGAGRKNQQGAGRRPHIVDAITNGEIQLVFNTTDGAQALADSRSLRRAALLHKVPYLLHSFRVRRGGAGYQGVSRGRTSKCGHC